MNRWTIDGVHNGKIMSELPITYLLWFVGSHQMRRTRWGSCQCALHEIYRRLQIGVEDVEADLIRDLKPKKIEDRIAMKERRRTYLRTIKNDPKCSSTSLKS